MASHFKWYPSDEEVVVPFNARYSYPSQANKSVKITPRIPPKNGAVFLPGNVIRMEFPAQGYVNPINTTLEFDVTMSSYGTPAGEIIRFQNNIQSIFSRARLLYGATPLEDIINYNVIVRALTEWTSTNQNGVMDQLSISEGIGGQILGSEASSSAAIGRVSVRQNYIQGIDSSVQGTVVNLTAGSGCGPIPNTSNTANLSGGGSYCTRRYQVNLAFGLLTQDKLIPVKFMASQLAIELTLEQPAACMFVQANAANATQSPSYGVSNVNLIPEILEFDASYDSMFLKGLENGGVPLKFASWHTFIFSTGAAGSCNLQVQERSRSVKALFAVQRRNPVSLFTDSGALLFDTSATSPATLQNYQWRIGGRYFPAQPVQLSTIVGSSISNGGAEAFVELQKALNVVGDYRLTTSNNTIRWASQIGNTNVGPVNFQSKFNEFDYTCDCRDINDGTPAYTYRPLATSSAGNSFHGTVGSNCYASAIDLEASNGVEISGLNAEEQSDIAFIANWATPQTAGFNLEVYSYYDSMIILRPNNVLELIL